MLFKYTTLIRLALYFLLSVMLIWKADLVYAQNLVPNPGFEIYNICPNSYGQGGPLVCPPWQNGGFTTADCFNRCATSFTVDVPANGFGWQQPHSGDGYAGAYHKAYNSVWHEYLQVQLSSPLVANKFYYVGTYVSLANYNCGVQNLGIYLSVNPPPAGSEGILVDPQVYWDMGFLSDTLNWTAVEGYYLAQGGEKWITLGNFELDSNTPVDPTCSQVPQQNSYYYYDDVWVIQEDPCEILDLDLGADVEACYSYTIDPGLSGYHYVWSTGSTDPTLTVTESGVYALTITDGCRVGHDQIQVTIHGNNPIDLGDNFLMLCAGETHVIQLNGGLGDYVWQDGSTSTEYTIQSTGQYSVTLDDGCGLSADTLVVEVLNLPGPFTLGGDIILCDNDAVTISFDENLGDFEWSNGSNESSFTITEEGTYSLTISNSCGEASDEIEVTHGTSPVVELGPDQVSICNGDILVFQLNENEGNYFWQDSTTSNEYEISLPGLYSVTVTNSCGTYDDHILVTLTPLPQVDLGSDFVICPAQLPDTLDVAGMGGTSVMWMDGSTLPQFIVTAAGAYSVTVSNACGAGKDTINVGVADLEPNVILPNDTTVCEGDSVWLYSAGDQGAYLWQNGTMDDSLLIKTPGQYILEVQTICGVGSDTANVHFNPNFLFPNLGPDIALCPGNSITLFVGDTFDTYLWQDMSTADSLKVSSPGIYTVTVSNQCGTGTDTVIVSATNAPPHLDLPDSLPLCSGSEIILDAGITGVDYLWNDGTDLGTLTISVPGTYSLTVNNNCGTDMDTVVIFEGGKLPFIELGNNIELCEGQSELLSPDFIGVDTWVWQDGSTGPTFLVNAFGLIRIEASNVCGSVLDSLYVTMLSGIPPLNLGNDTSLCDSQMLLLDVNIPDVDITWFDGSHDEQITIVKSGIYTAEISNACGVSSDTLIVTPLPGIPQLSLGPDQLLCPGEMITINPGILDVEYLWQDGTSASSFSTTQAGQIILTISNECGTSADSLLITESTQGPQLNLGPDITACLGDLVTVQAGIAGVKYMWQDSSTKSFYQTSSDAQLILHISNACGEDIDTIEVKFITPPDPDLGPDTVLCNGNALTLTSINNPLTTNTWQNGSHSSDFVVTTAGKYTLQQSNECGAKTDSILVSYSSTPSPFSLGPDLILCAGESVILQAPQTDDQILWQDGSNSTMMMANSDQVYSLTISNECGAAHDDVIVTIDSNIPIVPFDTMVICPGDILTLDASQPFYAHYIWSTGASNPSIDIQLPNEYSVTVMTNCYTVSETVMVIPSNDCKPDAQFFIPNIFSPNGDKINDAFTIQFTADADVISMVGDIFDRWGNLVFHSQQQPFSWDGTFDGKPMNPAVYVYKITLVYRKGANVVIEKLVGDVTLIK